MNCYQVFLKIDGYDWTFLKFEGCKCIPLHQSNAGSEFDLMTFDLTTFDLMTFDHMSFDHMAFDLITFDLGIFDPWAFDLRTFDQNVSTGD